MVGSWRFSGHSGGIHLHDVVPEQLGQLQAFSLPPRSLRVEGSLAPRAVSTGVGAGSCLVEFPSESLPVNGAELSPLLPEVGEAGEDPAPADGVLQPPTGAGFRPQWGV